MNALRFVKRWVTTALIWRAIYSVGVIGFALPFVSVRGCRSGEVTDYSGLQLVSLGRGWLLALPIFSSLVLLALSFGRPRGSLIRRSFVQGWRAALSALALGIISIVPAVLFFFEGDVRDRAGQWLTGVFAGKGQKRQESWAVIWGPLSALVLVSGIVTYLLLARVASDSTLVGHLGLLWLVAAVVLANVALIHGHMFAREGSAGESSSATAKP